MRWQPAAPDDDGVLAGRDASVAAVLIARNEAPTIEAALAPLVERRDGGLLDRVVVLDGGSSDGTQELAAAAGAEVLHAAEILPELGPVLGKGDSMWRTLAAVDSDIVAYLDADLTADYAGLVRGLVAPLLARPGTRFVKGAFRRIRVGEEGPRPFDGGRVTEMVGRPLLNLLRPDLARFYQPLGGQVAARHADLASIPYLTGYAVEIAMLSEAVDRWGHDAVVESDLGFVVNRERHVDELVPMAQEVMFGLLRRYPSLELDAWVPYDRPLPGGAGRSEPDPHRVVERPPMATYLAR